MLAVLKGTLMSVPLLLVSAPARAASTTSAARPGGRTADQGTGLGGLRPDPTAIPGGAQARSLLEGLMWYGLLVAAISLVVSAGLMGIGKWRRNPHQVESGQTGVLWSMGGAVAIGACSVLIGWAFNLGLAIK